MTVANTKPNLFEYDNYRSFLKDLYEHLKTEKRYFSFRYFSKAAGFRSPNFFKLVMDGERNLSSESIERFTQALKFNKRESEFFRHLVMFNQAQTVEEKTHYAEQVFKSSAYKKLNPLKKEQFDYYTHWYNIPIREMVGLKGFKNNAKWIAQNLRPQITPQEAAKSLSDLQTLGLIREENGEIKQSESIVSTGDEVSSASVAHFLKLMTLKGAEAVDLFDSKDRDVSSVTLTLSEKNFQHIKTLVQKFRKELLAIANQDENPEAVYQINFQLFPLTTAVKDKVGSNSTGDKP